MKPLKKITITAQCPNCQHQHDLIGDDETYCIGFCMLCKGRLTKRRLKWTNKQTGKTVLPKWQIEKENN